MCIELAMYKCKSVGIILGSILISVCDYKNMRNRHLKRGLNMAYTGQRGGKKKLSNI